MKGGSGKKAGVKKSMLGNENPRREAPTTMGSQKKTKRRKNRASQQKKSLRESEWEERALQIGQLSGEMPARFRRKSKKKSIGSGDWKATFLLDRRGGPRPVG